MKKYLLCILLILNLALIAICACQMQEAEQPPDIVAPQFYRLEYLATEGGSISGNTEQSVESGKNGTEVTAIPDNGYVFDRWSDDNSNNPARTDTNVNSNVIATAIFKKLTYTLKYETDGNGTLVGETNQTVKHGENAIAVTAIPDEGFKFVKWSDGKTTPQRNDEVIDRDEILIAIFEKITFTVRYECKEGMMGISLESGKGYGGSFVEFEVKYGEDCEKITGVKFYSDKHYYFVGWSDGLETEERQERNVTSDIVVRAKFGYELTYKVDENTGGRIIGNCRQLIEEGEDSQSVEAVADEGYVFCGWSDNVMGLTHRITGIERNSEYFVYFEPINKTFRYDYGEVVGVPVKPEITINRNQLNDVQFEIPQHADYVFRGWYADNEYQLKVVHESGKLMLGLQTLNLQTDTLYARWEKVDEEKKPYKILMIMVDDVYVNLYSTKKEDYVLVNYKMSGVERKLCSVIPPKISYYLNKWFEGNVIFEIDTYYTRQRIWKSSCLEWGIDTTRHRDYALFASGIEEINDIINEYDCTIVTYGMNDFNCLLKNSAGLGRKKEAMIRMESITYPPHTYSIHKMVEDVINYNGDGEISEEYYKYFNGLGIIVGYFHEFCHAIEGIYNRTGEVYDFHKWGAESDHSQMDTERLYLLGLGVLDGKTIGIPPEYWQNYYLMREENMVYT